jgi:cytochrome c-type biogenesis protein CcmH
MIGRLIFVFLMIFVNFGAFAVIQVFKFDDPKKEQQFNVLVQELRCPKCQNNNLADSNSDLSVDLKGIIYEKVIAGESNQQIIDYLKERYGDFISYRPPVNPSTWFIWFGPFIVLAIGALSIFYFLKTRTRAESSQLNQNSSQESIALLEQWNIEMTQQKDLVSEQLDHDELKDGGNSK